MSVTCTFTPENLTRLKAVSKASKRTFNAVVNDAIDYWYDVRGVGVLERATGMELPMPVGHFDLDKYEAAKVGALVPFVMGKAT